MLLFCSTKPRLVQHHTSFPEVLTRRRNIPPDTAPGGTVSGAASPTGSPCPTPLPVLLGARGVKLGRMSGFRLGSVAGRRLGSVGRSLGGIADEEEEGGRGAFAGAMARPDKILLIPSLVLGREPGASASGPSDAPVMLDSSSPRSGSTRCVGGSSLAASPVMGEASAPAATAVASILYPPWPVSAAALLPSSLELALLDLASEPDWASRFTVAPNVLPCLMDSPLRSCRFSSWVKAFSLGPASGCSPCSAELPSDACSRCCS